MGLAFVLGLVLVLGLGSGFVLGLDPVWPICHVSRIMRHDDVIVAYDIFVIGLGRQIQTQDITFEFGLQFLNIAYLLERLRQLGVFSLAKNTCLLNFCSFYKISHYSLMAHFF